MCLAMECQTWCDRVLKRGSGGDCQRVSILYLFIFCYHINFICGASGLLSELSDWYKHY